MNLYSYFIRLETVLHGRQDIDVEKSALDVTPEGLKFKCDLRFPDGSRLIVSEFVEQLGTRRINRIDYKFLIITDSGEAAIFSMSRRYPTQRHRGHKEKNTDYDGCGEGAAC